MGGVGKNKNRFLKRCRMKEGYKLIIFVWESAGELTKFGNTFLLFLEYQRVIIQQKLNRLR
ncbi:hypothetical protein SHPE106448_04720 [Shewanella pealeana]